MGGLIKGFLFFWFIRSLSVTEWLHDTIYFKILLCKFVATEQLTTTICEILLPFCNIDAKLVIAVNEVEYSLYIFSLACRTENT